MERERLRLLQWLLQRQKGELYEGPAQIAGTNNREREKERKCVCERERVRETEKAERERERE